MVEILFTTTSRLASRLIRAVTNEPMSHCAIRIGDTVLHSTFRGTTFQDKELFYKENCILATIQIPDSVLDLDNIVPSRHYYDFGAFFYLGIKLLLSRIKINLPKKNLWQSTGMYLCTEFITNMLNSEENSTITPYKLYLKLKLQYSQAN